LRDDGTLDKTATESFAPAPVKESEQCPCCDKKFMNLKSHIQNIHTCSHCQNATIRNMYAHHNICTPYLKWRESIRTTFPSESKKPICPYCSFCMSSDELVVHIAIAHTCSKCKEGKIKDLTEHMTTCGQPAADSAAAKKKKERIPAHIKTIVWRTYIGNEKPEAKCYCCKHETVDIRNFECGHVVAEAKGGPLTVDNLRPICRGCNGAMGTMSMEEYCQKFFGRSVISMSDEAEDVFGRSAIAAPPSESIEDVFGLYTKTNKVDPQYHLRDPEIFPISSGTLDPFAGLFG